MSIVNVLLIIGIIIGIIGLIGSFVYGITTVEQDGSIIGMVLSVIVISVCSLFLFGNIFGTKAEKTECNHQWVKVSSEGAIHTIYCPACKSEKEIDDKEWNKIQADIEYQKRQEH